MKVGHFISHFPYKRQFDNDMYTKNYVCGGAEIAAYNLITNLSKYHEINVFTSSINSKYSTESYEHIYIERYGSYFEIGNTKISPNLFRKPLIYDIDIIHGHNSTPPGVIAALNYAKNKDKPLIITHHGCGEFDNKFGSLIRKVGLYVYDKFLLDQVFSYADIIISPSEHFVEESKFLKRFLDKVVVIPNGVNKKDFEILYSKEECRTKLGLPIGVNILLFFGSLVRRKGPDVIIRAMKKIIKIVPNTLLIVAGTGNLKESLENLSKKLLIKDNIIFPGFIDESIKPIYFKAADIFILPSTMIGESFGIVNLEAMSCGIPIIASDIGGIPDVVEDGYNGLLVQPNNYNMLADNVIYLLENRHIRRKMGENGADKVENFSWDKIAKVTKKIYEELI